MSRKSKIVLILIVVLVLVLGAVAWLGGGALIEKVREMHGGH
jgi:hypothetical protein